MVEFSAGQSNIGSEPVEIRVFFVMEDTQIPKVQFVRGVTNVFLARRIDLQPEGTVHIETWRLQGVAEDPVMYPFTEEEITAFTGSEFSIYDDVRWVRCRAGANIGLFEINGRKIQVYQDPTDCEAC